MLFIHSLCSYSMRLSFSKHFFPACSVSEIVLGGQAAERGAASDDDKGGLFKNKKGWRCPKMTVSLTPFCQGFNILASRFSRWTRDSDGRQRERSERLCWSPNMHWWHWRIGLFFSCLFKVVDMFLLLMDLISLEHIHSWWHVNDWMSASTQRARHDAIWSYFPKRESICFKL